MLLLHENEIITNNLVSGIVMFYRMTIVIVVDDVSVPCLMVAYLYRKVIDRYSIRYLSTWIDCCSYHQVSNRFPTAEELEFHWFLSSAEMPPLRPIANITGRGRLHILPMGIVTMP